MKKKPLQIAVIGGGAAGFFGAIRAAEVAASQSIAAEVTIFEATSQFLKKVRISGGGRCNVTHHCFEPRELVQNYPRGKKELLSPLQKFQPTDTIEWFAKRGIKIVAEADGRMFPESNSSSTIIDCYQGEAERLGVRRMSHNGVESISVSKS